MIPINHLLPHPPIPPPIGVAISLSAGFCHPFLLHVAAIFKLGIKLTLGKIAFPIFSPREPALPVNAACALVSPFALW